MHSLFHLAFPVKDIYKTKEFYIDTLGCKVGKSSENWLNLNFFGHQLSIHLHLHMKVDPRKILVDGTEVPLNHFGVILKKEEWDKLAKKLTEKGIKFLIKPHIRHENQVCEQAAMFLTDPSGNGLEFKCYTDPKHIFEQ